VPLCKVSECHERGNGKNGEGEQEFY